MQHNTCYVSMSSQRLSRTRHAEKRCAQRAIDDRLFPLIRAYGERSFDGKGGVRYFMSQRALDMLLRVCGVTKQLQRLQGVYMVLDSKTESEVITAGHRH